MAGDNYMDNGINDIAESSQLFPQNNTKGNEGWQRVDNMSDAEESAPDFAREDAPDFGPGADRENTDREGMADAAFDPADLEVPEGFTVDPAVLDEFADKIRDMGLSQAQAQELVDLQVRTGQAQLAEHARIREAWVSELKVDPEYGGAAFERTVRDARTVMRRFDADGQVLDVLVNSGFGDNPAIIKMLARIKRSMSEDQFVSERGGGRLPEKSLAERLWPDPLR